MNKIFFFSSILLYTSTLLISCGPSDKTKNQNDIKTFEEAAQDETQNQIKNVIRNIPSPTEIPYMLQASGMDFNNKLIVPNRNIEQYFDRFDITAMLLGAYVTDIGYLSSYDKAQESIDYLNSCKDLAENMEIIGSFEVEDLKRFETHISDKDSLAFLLNESLKKTDQYLQDDNRNKISSLILTGSFIEGIFISTYLVQNYPKDMLTPEQQSVILLPIERVILRQRKSVEELIFLLNQTEETHTLPKPLMDDLNDLLDVYQSFDYTSLMEQGDLDQKLINEKIDSIATLVSKIRQLIL